MWHDLHGAKSAGLGAIGSVMDGERVSAKSQYCQQKLNPGMNAK